MKVHFLKSATTIIESNGVKILTDPWLVDGEYYGSWFHYPPFEFEPSAFDDIDYIYISHIHPDHFSRATLEKLNKDIPVLIHNYDIKFLKRNLESLGFTVTELPNNERTLLKDGVHINIFAADNCNPELCMKHFGCGRVESKFGSTQIDSLSVIDDGTFSVLNLNDCPFGLASHCAKQIREQYNAIDFMLVGYAGAGPFPQCISNFSIDEKKAAAVKKQEQFLKQGTDFINLFQPRFFMPFAGTYTLGGSLSELNSIRGVPEMEDAFEVLTSRTAGQGVLLNSGEHFDLESETPSIAYQPIDREEKSRYITEVLSTRKYTFENDPTPTLDQFTVLIPQAFERMTTVRKSIEFNSETTVVIPLVDGMSMTISMSNHTCNVISDQIANAIEPSVSFTVDPRLLLNILKGPRFGHWNNAEIGSHITFHRKPEQFERGLYYCMNFFFAGPPPKPHIKPVQIDARTAAN